MNLLSNAGAAAIGVIGGVGSALTRAGRIASVVSLTTGLIGVSIAKTGFNWRKTWNQARAVTAGTVDEMERLKTLVFELGASTKFTVSEVAGAVDFLGKAGNDAVEQIRLLPTMLDLAAAAGTALPRTADLMTNIAQGLRVAPSNIARYGDMLTAAFLNSNVTLQMLADTLKKFGPITTTLGADFADVATSIGLLGNAGIQGSEAGVHLRRMMINLSDSMSKMRTEVVDRLGLAWDDLDVKTRGFIPVLRTLSRVFLNESGKIKSAEMFALASRIFGARAVSTALALMGQLETGYDDLSTSIRNSAGAMRDTAALQLEGLEPFYRLQAAFELLKISISESGVLDTFAKLAEKLAGYFQNMAGASEETRRLAFGILTLITVIGPVIFILGLLISAIARIGSMLLFLGSVVSFLMTPLGLLTVAILAVVGAAVYLGLKGTDGIKSFVDGSSPLLTALADIVFGVVGFVKAAIDDDWAKAWGYAKDVIASVAVVAVLVLKELANGVLLVFKNIVHYINTHWEQISASTMKALEWLFTTTEGWLVVFTLMMFKGFRNMALGIVSRVVWMAEKVFAAFLWLAKKLGADKLWGRMWEGLRKIARAGAQAILDVVKKFAELMLDLFKKLGHRIAAWPIWGWLHAKFLAMYQTIVNMTAAWATSILLIFRRWQERIAGWRFFQWFQGTFLVMYRNILAATSAWATGMLLTYREFGFRAAAWQFFDWLVDSFKRMYQAILSMKAAWASKMLLLKNRFAKRVAQWKIFEWLSNAFLSMYNRILKIKAAWMSKYFLLYERWRRILVGWKIKFALWYQGTFLTMYRNVLTTTRAWATTMLLTLNQWGQRIAQWKFFQWFVLAFRKMYAYILAMKAAWATSMIVIKNKWATRVSTWGFFVWFTGKFAAMFQTILNALGAWAGAFLGVLKKFALKLGPRILSIVARFSNPWVAAATVIITVIAAFWRELWRGMKGAGSVIKEIALHGAEGFANAWIWGFNKVMSGFEWLGRKMIQTLNAIIRKLNKLPFVNIGLLDENLVKLPRLSSVDLGGGNLAQAFARGSDSLSGQDFVDAAKRAWNNFKKPFVEVFDALGDLGHNVLNFATEVGGKLTPLYTTITSKILGFLDFAVGGLENLADSAWQKMKSFALDSYEWLGELKPKIQDAILTVAYHALKAIAPLGTKIADAAVTVVEGFWKGLVKIGEFNIHISGQLLKFILESASKIGDFATTVYGSMESFVTEVVGGIGEFITAIAQGDWKRVGELAAKALNATVGEAFRFLANIGGKIAKSILAPASKAAIEAALGGLGYVFSQLDLALQAVKPLADVDPDKVRESIYKILEDAGISTDDREIGEGYVPPDGVIDTPEERKDASIHFITQVIADLKRALTDMFDSNGDGEPDIPDGSTIEDLVGKMNDLGLDVDELGQLWDDVNNQYTTEPVTVDPSSLTSDLSPGGSSGPSRSLTGTLAGLTLKVLVQIGDRPFEDAVVESLFSADRGGRLQGLDA